MDQVALSDKWHKSGFWNPRLVISGAVGILFRKLLCLNSLRVKVKCEYVCRCLWRAEVLDLLEQKVQWFIGGCDLHKWVLGSELGSSLRAVLAPNC